jgi:hypothetical protein
LTMMSAACVMLFFRLCGCEDSYPLRGQYKAIG